MMFEGLQAIRKELKEAKLENPDREEIHDGYQLRFVGKDYAKFITTLPTQTVLVPDSEWNNKEQNKNSENIFITGDNLDALKHLENAYSGRIKMIYIDPPYNTGSDGFVYNDRFGFSEEQLRGKLGLSEDEVARIKALEGKCSHSAWLTFMLPRLAIAKRLLSDDGVIFISIDDNEQANLKLLCNQIFTENNYVGTFIWRKKDGGGQATDYFSIEHEYILCYKKSNQLKWIDNQEERKEKEYNKTDIDGKKFKITKLAKWGNTARREDRPTMYFPLIAPDGQQVYPIAPDGSDGRWRIGKGNMENLISENLIHWEKKSGGWIPYEKEYFTNQIKNIKQRSILYDIANTGDGTDVLTELFGKKDLFENPKPVELIYEFLMSTTNKNDIILDFFAGSSTTAHAVMALNKKYNGNRKYIMVQLDEPTKENGEARKAGYNTIDQISRDRIKKAAEQLGDTSGFKHYKLAKVEDAKVLNKIDTFNPNEKNLLADNMLEPFSGKSLNTTLQATGTQTLLTTWLVDDGYTLTTPIREVKFGNYTAYMPQDSHRLYLIDTGWNSDTTKDLLNKIGKNNLIIQSIVIYNHSFDFTALTELKNNLKSVLSNEVKLIERF